MKYKDLTTSIQKKKDLLLRLDIHKEENRTKLAEWLQAVTGLRRENQHGTTTLSFQTVVSVGTVQFRFFFFKHQ